MSTLKSIDPVLKQPKTQSEVECELAKLEAAKVGVGMILQRLGNRLDDAGALVPPLPEPCGDSAAEEIPSSPLGARIRNTRRDLQDMACDFERLLSRLAI